MIEAAIQPMKSEETTSLVIRASTIAKMGGTREKKPMATEGYLSIAIIYYRMTECQKAND